MKRAKCINRSPLEKFVNTIYIFSVILMLTLVSLSIGLYYLKKLTGPYLIVFTVLFVCFLIFSFLFYLRSICIEPMTRVANQGFIYAHIASLYKRNQLKNFTCFFFNIKDCKYINRQYSKEGGNLVFYEFAQKMKKFTKHGELSGRLGGDNFCAIIRTSRVQEFLDYINDIPVEIFFKGKKHNVVVTCRVGIYSADETSVPKDMLDNSGFALNFARENGVLVAWYKNEIQKKFMNNKELIAQYSDSLKNQDFKVYYQPKFDMKTGKICGAEALSRWNLNNNLIYPIDYISMLEDDGSIIQLDFYMLEKVCSSICEWKKIGKTVPRISVNFSRFNLHDLDVADKVLSIFHKYGINHDEIEIEITESAGYENYEGFARFVQKMNSEKITVSIDDFGVGYSALALIKNLPVSVVKLDKSFLNDVSLSKQQDLDFLKNLINMIKAMDTKVICEGVETEEHKQILLESGCEQAQGYLYSKPLAVEEFEKQYL